MSEIKQELLYEDEDIKVTAIPSLLRIVIQCKTKGSYEANKRLYSIMPEIAETLKGLALGSVQS